jgi:hypothetical protein
MDAVRHSSQACASPSVCCRAGRSSRLAFHRSNARSIRTSLQLTTNFALKRRGAGYD